MDENIKCKLFLFVKSCHFIVLFKRVGYIDQPYVLIAFLEIVSHLNQPWFLLEGHLPSLELYMFLKVDHV